MTISSSARAKLPRLRDKTITLAHGSGGQAMQDLIAALFVSQFEGQLPTALEDQARIPLAELTAQGDRLAFTTDSYVVDPLFFPGGDIGSLAVNGTVNDLAVSGAVPRYLTCAMILEEGLPIDVLKQVVASMVTAAQQAGVKIVTGDTKVVPRGGADKLFINTAGVGVMRRGVTPAAVHIQPGDAVLVNGPIGNHGATILVAREQFALETEIHSDCQPLNGLVDAIVTACPAVRAMRDATRGGLATVLNEFAESAQVGIRLIEDDLPVDEAVRGLCELLGLDPLYLANEGKLVVVVPPDQADTVLAAMQTHPAGVHSRVIGHVIDGQRVALKTGFGTDRILDRLVGDQLPRIC
ncbi:hydrogenase expression/formation protein HypE [Leptolyngbya iicbica]|uniref:Hydrogenase expression/formation protein HypE n=2 Tax=Cyanophyceae TaxID=3028117 RepID=A0A4Q7EJ25_9CYAN|nr:hydrogenase expression/formation protein HypE [Leptolyngbya sp. LK]RZM81789.1 hydrogenase expression/formation protein HypE [Leptolyngbya sp. LK]